VVLRRPEPKELARRAEFFRTRHEPEIHCRLGAIALTTIWWTVGFNFLLYLAALQAIPEQLYEAASLDGANACRS